MMTKRPSGKFIVRVPPPLHGALQERAQKEGLSLNQLCLEALAQGVGHGIRTRLEQRMAKLAGLGGFEKEIEEIVNLQGDKLQAILLFGSTARGEATAESDVDLALVVKEGIKIRRALYKGWPFEKISPHFLALPSLEDAGGIWLELALEGIPLWQRNLRVGRFLLKVRTAIIEGEVQVGYLHGHRYWIRTSRKNKVA